MRSRTSRGVRNGPEVKIYIWEVLFWSPEEFRGLSVTYRDHREGPRGLPGGATGPRGLHGPSVGGDQPQVGWCAPHPGPRRLGFGETLKGGAPLPWGARQPPWPPPPPQIGSEGAGPPLPCPYIYVGGGRAAAPKSWRSPSPLPSPPLLPRCLAKPCRIATLILHHHAVVLLLDGAFPNLSFFPCWIKA